MTGTPDSVFTALAKKIEGSGEKRRLKKIFKKKIKKMGRRRRR
jgi:hypothetical protein